MVSGSLHYSGQVETVSAKKGRGIVDKHYCSYPLFHFLKNKNEKSINQVIYDPCYKFSKLK